MTRLERVECILRRRKPELKRRFKLTELGIFGSRARGNGSRESDLDVLVDFSEVPGLLGFLRLEEAISRAVGMRVDLVMKRALKPGIAERVLSEVVYI